MLIVIPRVITKKITKTQKVKEIRRESKQYNSKNLNTEEGMNEANSKMDKVMSSLAIITLN